MRRGGFYAVSAFVAVLAVARAFGIGADLFPFFEGKPAPEAVKASFERLSSELLPDGARGKVIVAEARGAVAAATERGPIRLWVAPTEDGTLCRLIQIGDQQVEDHAFSCGPRVLPERVPVQAGLERLRELGNVTLIDGRTGPRTVAVDVERADGSLEHLPVVESFFLAAFESDDAVHRPRALVITTIRDGNQIESRLPLPDLAG